MLGAQTRAWGKGQGRLPKGSDRLLANFSVLGCLLEYHIVNMMKHILFYLSWRVFCFVFVYTRDRCFNQGHVGHYLNYLPPTPSCPVTNDNNMLPNTEMSLHAYCAPSLDVAF